MKRIELIFKFETPDRTDAEDLLERIRLILYFGTLNDEVLVDCFASVMPNPS